MNTQEWMCLRLVVMLAVVMVASPTSAVPKRVANRMVPSWWSRVRNTCWSASDCGGDECCARPMLSSKAYCMPLRSRGQVCDASPLMLSINNGVYFSDCPCQFDLTCASLGIKAKPQCVDLRTLELDYRRIFSLTVPPASENH